MSKDVDYYVSLASPYTYMGGKHLPEVIESTGATFLIKPVIGSQLLAATGGLPVPKRHPARLSYRLVELRRWKRHWAIPMNTEPKYFPVDDGKAAHMVIAARELGQNAVALSNAFLACVWEAEQDISDTSVLVAAANLAGFDGETLAEKINADDIVRLYQSNTDEAIEREVFGMPWFIYDGIPYWGQDRIPFLKKALLG